MKGVGLYFVFSCNRDGSLVRSVFDAVLTTAEIDYSKWPSTYNVCTEGVGFRRLCERGGGGA